MVKGLGKFLNPWHEGLYSTFYSPKRDREKRGEVRGDARPLAEPMRC